MYYHLAIIKVGVREKKKVALQCGFFDSFNLLHLQQLT